MSQLTKEEIVRKLYSIHLQAQNYLRGLRDNSYEKLNGFIVELENLEEKTKLQKQILLDKIKTINQNETHIVNQIKAAERLEEQLTLEKKTLLWEQQKHFVHQRQQQILLQQQSHHQQIPPLTNSSVENSNIIIINSQFPLYPSPLCINSDLLTYTSLCNKYISFYKDFKETLHRNPNFDSFSNQQRAIEIKMRINKRIGQISKTLKQINFVANDLVVLLNETQFNDEFYYKYTLYLISNKIIEQGISQIASFIPSAYFISLTIIKIGGSHAQLLKVLFGKLLFEFPFVVGNIPSIDLNNDSQEDYLKKLGYVFKTSTKSFETLDTWQVRMSGLLSLFSALLQCPDNKGGLFDPALAWIWLSFVLNTRPSSLTPLILVTFLEIGGFGLYVTYKTVFIKLLYFIKTTYLGFLLQQQGLEFSTQGMTRLGLYLEQLFPSKSTLSLKDLSAIKIKEPESRVMISS